MTKTVVYLAGKMSGLTLEEMTAWRMDAERLLNNNFRTLNPVNTELSSRPTDREMTASNKFQIKHSDIVLAEINHDEVSIGTIGEIITAWENKKPVIAWGRAEKIINHPWVKDHIVVAFPILRQAVNYINRNYSK